LTRIIRTLPGTISSLSSSKYCAALHGRTVFFEPASSAVQRLRHSAEVHHKKWVNDFTAFSVVYTTGTVVPSHKSELERFGIVKMPSVRRDINEIRAGEGDGSPNRRSDDVFGLKATCPNRRGTRHLFKKAAVVSVELGEATRSFLLEIFLEIFSSNLSVYLL
jgi:hypothetical protein